MRQVDLVEERVRLNIDLYIPKRGLSDSGCSEETINLLASKTKTERLPLSFYHYHVRTTMSSQYHSTINHPSQGSSDAAGSTPTQGRSVITALDIDIWDDDKTEGEYQQTTEVYNIPVIPSYEEMKLLPGQYAPDDCLFCEEKGRTVDVGLSIWTLLLCSQTSQWFKPYRTDGTYEMEGAQEFRVCDEHRGWILLPEVLGSLRKGPLYLGNGRGWFSILFVHAPANSVVEMPQPSTGEADSVAELSQRPTDEADSSQWTAPTTFVSFSNNGRENVSLVESTVTVADHGRYGNYHKLRPLSGITYETGPKDQLRCSICSRPADSRKNIVRRADKIDKRRSNYHGILYPMLFPIYWDRTAGTWYLSYKPSQIPVDPQESLKLRACDQLHKELLQDLVNSTRGFRQGDIELAHETLPHLTVQLMTMNGLKAKAAEVKAKETPG